MQHAITRIDTSQGIRDVSMFFYFFAGYIDASLQKNTGEAGVYYFTRRPHGIKSRVE